MFEIILERAKNVVVEIGNIDKSVKAGIKWDGCVHSYFANANYTIYDENQVTYIHICDLRQFINSIHDVMAKADQNGGKFILITECEDEQFTLEKNGYFEYRQSVNGDSLYNPKDTDNLTVYTTQNLSMFIQQLEAIECFAKDYFEDQLAWKY